MKQSETTKTLTSTHKSATTTHANGTIQKISQDLTKTYKFTSIIATTTNTKTRL